MTRIATTLTVALVALLAFNAEAKTVTRTRTLTTTLTQASATKTVQAKNCKRSAAAVEARDADDDDALFKRARHPHPANAHPTVHVTVTKTRTKSVKTRTVTAACAAQATGTTPAGSTTAAATPTTGASLNNAYDVSTPQDLVGMHNVVRAQHGANALVWDQTLADFALQYGSQCKNGHSGTPGYGENLAFGAPPSYYTDQALFDLWANEQNGYDYNSNTFSEERGHFTQVVWKATTNVGCAVVTCPAQYGPFGQPYKSLTCEYTPPGNVEGGYQANVGRPQ